MTDMKYELFSPEQRQTEAQTRLANLEQQHYVLTLNQRTGINMGAASSVMVGGVPSPSIPAPTPVGFDPSSGETAEDVQEKQIQAIEKAITELRKELKAIETEIKNRDN